MYAKLQRETNVCTYNIKYNINILHCYSNVRLARAEHGPTASMKLAPDITDWSSLCLVFTVPKHRVKDLFMQRLACRNLYNNWDQ